MGCRRKSVPDFSAQLDLGSNQLKDLPAERSTVLGLDASVCIPTVPSVITTLNADKSPLRIECSGVLPGEIGNLGSLELLMLSGTPITALP
jgi:Leucine-rich repeat (LRR) protein